MQINFVVALPAEARPINARFGLKRRQPDGDFPVYRNDETALVLCGVGKAAAAAATRFLHGRNGSPNGALWLNAGIAGHPSAAIGTPMLARRISDAETGQAWEARFGFEPPCAMEDLVTLGRPGFGYDRPCAFDMEAAGFFSAARGITAPGLVQCFKVISDNRDNPGHGISAKTVSRLIEARLDTLALLLARMGKSVINSP